MSAPLVVPFNFKPISVSVKTASYTIPANKYARVLVNLIGSATFSINGTTALQGSQWTVLASDNLATRTDTSLTPATVTLSTTTNVDYGSSGTAFNESTAYQNVIAELWLPAGTEISGTGTWRAVVMEYNEIS